MIYCGDGESTKRSYFTSRNPDQVAASCTEERKVSNVEIHQCEIRSFLGYMNNTPFLALVVHVAVFFSMPRKSSNIVM